MKNIDSMKDRLYSLRHGNLFRLGERFPQVTRVLVIYKAKSGSWDGRETEGKIELNPDMLLNALVECPNATCTGIGIDLNNEVFAAVRSNLHHIAGEKECDGWEDEKRYGKHKCGSKIHYDITVEYHKSNP